MELALTLAHRHAVAQRVQPERQVVCHSQPLGSPWYARRACLVTAAEGNLGMLVGGVPIDEQRLRELARIVQPTLARRIDTALLYRARVLGLTVAERKAILTALETPPPGLEELRGVLLGELEWQRAEGL